MRSLVVGVSALACSYAFYLGDVLAQDGAAAFDKHCATCHLPATAAPSPEVPSVETLRSFPPEAILNSLLNGRMRIQGTPLGEGERRAVAEFLGGRPLQPRSAGASVVHCAATPSFTGPGAGRRMERLGQRRREHTLCAARGTHGPRSAAAHAQVGVRLRRRDLGACATLTRRQPALHCERQRRSSRARPCDGLRLLVVSRRGHRANGPTRRALRLAHGRRAMGRVLRRSARERLRRRRDERPVDLDPQARRASARRHHGHDRVPRRPPLRARAGVQRGGARRSPGVRVLHVPRQPLRARAGHGQRGLEDLHDRGAAIARHERGRHAAVGTCGWWHLVVADDRREAWRPLRQHGQRLLGPAATDDGRRHWARHRDGARALVASIHRKRQLDARLRPHQRVEPELPRHARPRLRFRRLRRSSRSGAATCSCCRRSRGCSMRSMRRRTASWCGSIASALAAVAAAGRGQRRRRAPCLRRRHRLHGGRHRGRRPRDGPTCLAGIDRPNRCSAARSRAPAAPAQGAAVTAIPGAVLSGSLDGGLRAFAANDGELLWQFDTNRAFTTVNGVAAKGGSMDAAGPTVAGRLLIVNAGYGGIASMPGNVLLVFGVE